MFLYGSDSTTTMSYQRVCSTRLGRFVVYHSPWKWIAGAETEPLAYFNLILANDAILKGDNKKNIKSSRGIFGSMAASRIMKCVLLLQVFVLRTGERCFTIISSLFA